MADLAKQLRDAEAAHFDLRAENPVPENLERKSKILQRVLPVLAEVYDSPESRAAPDLRRTVTMLRLDAEYFAGRQAEAEGYRRDEDVRQAYELLRAAS